MATRKRRIRQYVAMGRSINDPAAVARVKGVRLDPPTQCRYCKAPVALINNAEIYGAEHGWPLTYACTHCSAKVGTHPGTDIPLGTLANRETATARRLAHAALDTLWQGKGTTARTLIYRSLAQAMGRPTVHISWLDARECRRVVELAEMGALSR